MKQVSMTALLEAGAHFGHKAERWHPKAGRFIYTEKDGIHIIDLAKTKAELERAMAFVHQIALDGGTVLFVGTKRQAKEIVKTQAAAAGAPYLAERWIGGFLTNWDGIHANIAKSNRLTEEQATGKWKKLPKHEQSQLGRYLKRLHVYYGGVLKLDRPPQALFIIDIKREIAAVREAVRCGIPVIAVVDTNANPDEVEYAIPANDDAIGSLAYIMEVMTDAFREGHEGYEKNKLAQEAEIATKKAKAAEQQKHEETKEVNEVAKAPESAPVKEAKAAKQEPVKAKKSSKKGAK